MAKKKLNKKVAIIGTVLAACIAVGVIVALLMLNRDPQVFLADAEAAKVRVENLNEKLAAVDEPTLEQKEQIQSAYKDIERNYQKAYGYAKSNEELKIDILFRLADYYLRNERFHEAEWAKARNCWANVLNIDPKHVKARTRVLDFVYTAATSLAELGIQNDGRQWVQVKETADQLLEVYEERSLTPDTFALKAQGRAAIEIADAGLNTELEETAKTGIQALEKVIETDPQDIDAYTLLARAHKVLGEVRQEDGVMGAVAEATKNRTEILQKAIDISPDSPKAKIALLEMNSARLNEQMTKTRDQARQQIRENLEALETQFKDLANEYPNDPEVYAAQASYYGSGVRMLDQAVEAMYKAWQLDKNDVKNSIKASRLMLYKYNVQQDQQAFTQAVAIAENALNAPATQDVAGPRQAAARIARLNLLSFLGQCYTTKALETDDETAAQPWITRLENSVDKLVQYFGTEDNPNVQKWRGMLALVKDQKSDAIRMLYNAYNQTKAAGNNDAFLSETLAGIFKDRREIGLRRQFITDALSSGSGSYKPQLMLDYAEVMSDLGSAAQVISLLDEYENLYGPSDRVAQLKAAAYMRAGDTENAQQIIERLDETDQALSLQLVLTETNIRRLVNDLRIAELSDQAQAQDRLDVINEQLSEQRNKRVEIFHQLIARKAQDVPVPKATCDDLVRIGQADRARKLIDAYAQAYPSAVDAKIYSKLLEQDNPLQLSAQQRENLVKDVLGSLDEEYDSQLNLGLYYSEIGETEKAVDQLKKALAADPEAEQAISGLFDAAVKANDIETAQEMAAQARKLNLDQCDGNFFQARLRIAQEDYTGALELLDLCLESRPVFPYAHVLKSKCYAELDNYTRAVDEARTADRMVQKDGQIAKQLVSVLQKRNEALRGSLTITQEQELETALQKAVALNPTQWQLQAMYGQYLLEKRPTQAIAILQNLANRMPSSETLTLLGNAAVEIAKRETDSAAKQNLFEIARSSLSKAYALDPSAAKVQTTYAEYLRITGQQDKAVELFGNDASTMWRFYVRDGQFNRAEEVLQELYAKDKTDVDILKGLMTVALRTSSPDKLKKYSQQLLAIDDSIENQLLQIQSYLEMDLVKEANDKLQAFRQDNPDESRAVLLEAWAAMSRGELEKALDLVDTVISGDQKNAIAYRLRGQINGLLGNFEKAINDMQESKNINSNPTVQMELARIYKRAGRVPEAIGELVGAVEDDRAPMETWIMLESLYTEAGTKAELEAFYRKTVGKFRDNSYWHFKYAAFLLRDRKYAAAEDLFLKALELSRTDSGRLSALDGYMTALRLGKKYDQLYKFAAKYTDDKLAPVAYAQIATAKNQQDDRQAAVDNFKKALDAAGTNEQYVLKILDSMFNVLGANDVIAWCKDTLAENPDSMTANLTMYKISQATRQFDQGLEYVDKCMQLTGDNRSQWLEFAAMKAQLLLIAYMTNPTEEYLQAAIDQHQAILDKQPNNSNVMNNLAYLLAKSGKDMELALQYARRAHETTPNDHNKMDTYGYVLCKAGNYEKAQEIMLMAIQLAEKDSPQVEWSYYEHLGMAHEGLGKNSLAAEAYKTAINLAKEQISTTDKTRLETALTRVADQS